MTSSTSASVWSIQHNFTQHRAVITDHPTLGSMLRSGSTEVLDVLADLATRPRKNRRKHKRKGVRTEAGEVEDRRRKRAGKRRKVDGMKERRHAGQEAKLLEAPAEHGERGLVEDDTAEILEVLRDPEWEVQQGGVPPPVGQQLVHDEQENLKVQQFALSCHGAEDDDLTYLHADGPFTEPDEDLPFELPVDSLTVLLEGIRVPWPNSFYKTYHYTDLPTNSDDNTLDTLSSLHPSYAGDDSE